MMSNSYLISLNMVLLVPVIYSHFMLLYFSSGLGPCKLLVFNDSFIYFDIALSYIRRHSFYFVI